VGPKSCTGELSAVMHLVRVAKNRLALNEGEKCGRGEDWWVHG